MNKIYSTVWNKKLGCVVAASEHARRHGGAGGSTPGGTRATALALIAAALALFPIQESAALTLGANTSTGASQGNTAIGDNSRAEGGGYAITVGGNRRNDAYGLSVTNLPGSYGIALGYGAQSQNVMGTALGSYALTRGDAALAVGNSAHARGRVSMAIGTGAYTSAGNAMAIGSFSAGAAARAMAIGNVATASGEDSNAIGTSANASGARSIAFGAAREVSVVNGQEALQNTTTNTSASGEDSVAIGTGARSTGKDTIALGTGTTAAGTGTLALGAGASAAGTDSVALGSAAAATGAGAVAIGAGASANSDGGAAAGVAIGRNARSASGGNISIGDSAMAGGSDSVAIGRGASTVNTSGVNKQVALGDSARTGASGALALGYDANASSQNSVALGAFSTTTSDPTAAAFNPGAGTLSGQATAAYGEVSVGAVDRERRVTNVAAGAAPTDAVNVSQLRSEAEKTATTGRALAAALGGDASYDATTGEVSAPSYSVGGGAVASVGAAIGNLDGRVNAAQTSIEGLDGRLTTAEGDITTINTNIGEIRTDITNLDGRMTSAEGSIATLSDQLEAGEAGLVRQDAATGGISVAADKAGTTVDFTGTDGARTLTGVAAGDLAADSTDAVNGSQLFATNERVSTAEGDIATINTNVEGLDDRLTTTEGNVTDLTGRLDTAEGDILTINTNIGEIRSDITNLDGRMTSAEGSIATLSDQLEAGEAGLVRQGADTGAITVAAEKAGSTVDFTGTDGARTLTGVAAGELAADSTDAVNGAQLFATNERVSTAEGDITTINTNVSNLDGRMTTVEGSVTNLTEQLESGEAGLVRWVEEDGAVTVAADKAGTTVDFTGTEGSRTLTGVAAGELAADSTDAVNGAQLFATNERVSTAEGDITTINTNVSNLDGRVTTVEGDVTTINTNVSNLDGRMTTVEGSVTNLTEQLDAGEAGLVRQDADTGAITVAADKAGSTVDFTGTDGARTLTGVAAGELAEDSTDAVNGSQLFATNERVSAAKSDITTINTNVEGLDDRLTTTEGNVTGLTDRMDTAEGGITTINTNIGEIRSDITNLDGRMTSAEGSIATLSDQLDTGEVGLVRQDADTGAITVAADKGGSTVDFTGTDGARTLTGVAAGELAEDSTDAVNGSQLFATNERVSTTESDITTINTNVAGLDGRLTTAEGDITTINTNVAGLDDRLTTTEGNVTGLTDRMDTAEGDITAINTNMGEIRTDITNLDGRMTSAEGSIATLSDQLDAGEAGLVRQNADTGGITVAADKAGTTVDFTGTDGARTLTGVAAGELAADSTDAVNGSQLFATNERVSTAEGDIATINTNVAGLDDRLTTTEGNVTDLTGRMDTAEGDITAINTNVGNLDGRMTTVEGSLAGLSDELNAGETGLVRRNADTGAITVAADKAGSTVDFAGIDGPRTLTGVAAGELAADSTDAVNGAQLFATNERLGGAEAEITTINTGIGEIRTDITGLDSRVTTVEGSVGELKDSLNSGQTGLVRQNPDTGVIAVAGDKGGTAVSFANVDGQARVLSGVADGTEETDAVNVRQLRSTGLVDEDGKARDAVTYDSGSERGSVTFNSAGAPVLLQNVAAGRANTDAANVGQVRDAVSLMGGGAGIDANGNVVAPNYVVEDVTYTNVGDALKGLAEQVVSNKDRVTVVEQVTSNLSNAHVATSGDQKSTAKAEGSNAVALGAAANASGSASTATGWGAQASGDSSIAIGSNSQALGDNSMAVGASARAVAGNGVAIGTGSVATREDTVSVGSVGNERAIANVADGVAETDAVNKRQLDSSMNSALNYTNQQLNQLQNEIQSVKRDGNANAAAAMAVANLPQSVIPGKGMASAAVSNMGGESAVAVGVSKFSEDGRWVTKLSGTVNTRGNAGVAAGIGFHW